MKLIEYDATGSTLGSRRYMRVKARIDSWLPLKRKKKIQLGRDRAVYACFQYEKLSFSASYVVK